VSATIATPVARPAGLSALDRFLTLWIVGAMLFGVALGAANIRIPSVIVPIGLVVMMYPPFARVRYEALPAVFRDLRLLGLSIAQNWIVGPLLMFAVAALCLPHHPDYFAGLVLIGLARCIAMVVVWNDIAQGDREFTAALVAMNSLFQIFAYGALAYLFLTLLPPLVGMRGLEVHLTIVQVALNVGLYLGVPFVAGALTRLLVRPRVGVRAYDRGFVPRVAPLTLVALLVTIVAMFSLQGARIIAHPLDVLLVAFPLVVYFVIMFVIAFVMGRGAHASYERTVSLALTAASNNFELAIAVCVALFGIDSGQAFAAVIGPLIEVPVMLVLVRVALRLRSGQQWAAVVVKPLADVGPNAGQAIFRSPHCVLRTDDACDQSCFFGCRFSVCSPVPHLRFKRCSSPSCGRSSERPCVHRSSRTQAASRHVSSCFCSCVNRYRLSRRAFVSIGSCGREAYTGSSTSR
jgi:ACR3 family arsenite transporter